MKTLVLFYSYTGSCKTVAEKIAEKQGADTEEIRTVKRPGKVGAYVLGSFAAMRHKAVAIQPVRKDLNRYDSFILVAPIWAGNPAPAFNSMLELLPAGKSVELHFVSGSGKSASDQIMGYVQGKGVKVTGYYDVKQSEVER